MTPEKYRKHIIDICDKNSNIGPLDDGYQYYWPNSADRGAYSAEVLRIIADELDKRNKWWDEQVQQAFHDKEYLERESNE